jgi:chemotaxis protein methyltransferase CheR
MDATYPLKKKYHIVFCRNVFIYFDRPTQKQVLERIYANMSPDGYLFMGHSENISMAQLPLKNVSAAVYAHKTI